LLIITFAAAAAQTSRPNMYHQSAVVLICTTLITPLTEKEHGHPGAIKYAKDFIFTNHRIVIIV